LYLSTNQEIEKSHKA